MGNKKIERILKVAKETIQKEDGLKSLLKNTSSKIEDVSEENGDSSSFVTHLRTVIRMIKAHYTGAYKAFSATTMLALAFVLVYFITPIDLIPDFIPGLGLSDDISLFYFIFKNLAEDIEAFQNWESEEENASVS